MGSPWTLCEAMGKDLEMWLRVVSAGLDQSCDQICQPGSSPVGACARTWEFHNWREARDCGGSCCLSGFYCPFPLEKQTCFFPQWMNHWQTKKLLLGEEQSQGGSNFLVSPNDERVHLQFISTCPSRPFYNRKNNEKKILSISRVQGTDAHWRHEAPSSEHPGRTECTFTVHERQAQPVGRGVCLVSPVLISTCSCFPCFVFPPSF